MTARAVLVGVCAAILIANPSLAQDLAVIVHAERQAQLSIGEVGQIYLKRRRFWEDGERILPVNRDSESVVRELFVRAVFGEEAPRLAVYWNRQYFRGVLPPATLASDEAVVRFVSGERRAIGYVRRSAVDDSVSVVLPIEDDGADDEDRAATGGP